MMPWILCCEPATQPYSLVAREGEVGFVQCSRPADPSLLSSQACQCLPKLCLTNKLYTYLSMDACHSFFNLFT